jgi:hypothetical protein
MVSKASDYTIPVKMPYFRLKTLFPLVAIFSITLFFWCIDRYDRNALLNLKRPIEHLSGGSPSGATTSKQVQIPQQKFSGSTCAFDPASAPPLPFSEWLVRKNFSRTYFRPHHVGIEAEFRSLEDIDDPVLPPFRALERGTVLSNENEDPTLPCPPVIDVDVATDHDSAETAKMLFGIATTADRLERLLPSLLYSFGDSKAGVLALVPESDDDLQRQEDYFRARGLDITIESSPLEFTARYFGLVEAFAYHVHSVRPQTQWLGFIDDDTFFPSLATVAEQLKQFDPSKKHYIGSLSEASWQVDTFGHIAFGGAGVFISRAMLEHLMNYYEDCQSWGEQPGDQKLGQCIERSSDTPLTLWPSLYQMDVTGEPDGIFESGRPINSLHHWGSWYHKDVVKMSAVAASAGKRSVLRRWVFDQQEAVNNETGTSVRTFWVLTNGYSIVRYTLDEHTPNTAVNFDHAEKTWEEDISGYQQRLGPLRSKDQPGVTKERWLLRDATVVGDNVHQLYSREEEATHSLIEIVWLGPVGGGGAGVGRSPTDV